MNYDVIITDEFAKDVKKLYKKYKQIKNDLLDLIDKLEVDYKIGISLGEDLYKIRVKNSDIGGKRGGYRVIYFFKKENKIYLLTIYSKTQIENINIEKLKPILNKIKDTK